MFPMEWCLSGQPVIRFMRRPHHPMIRRSDIAGEGGGWREVFRCTIFEQYVFEHPSLPEAPVLNPLFRHRNLKASREPTS